MGRNIVAVLVLTAVLTAVLAGCGSRDAAVLPAVTGAVWQRPTVKIPDAEPAKRPVIRVLHQGDGAPVQKGQVAIVQYELRTWKDNRRLASGYTKQQPMTVIMDGRHLAPTWTKALTGRRAGSRVLLVAPARQGFGPNGFAPIGTSPTDTVIAVLDVIGGYWPTAQINGPDQHSPADGLPGVDLDPDQPAERSKGVAVFGGGTAPRFVDTPKNPPTRLIAEQLIAGTGPKITQDSRIVLQYASAQWGKSEPYDSSRAQGGPDAFVFSGDSVPPGWRQTFVGRRVGSRILLAVPARMNRGFQMTTGGVPVPPTASIHLFDILDAT